jgi:hypothetical protein
MSTEEKQDLIISLPKSIMDRMESGKLEFMALVFYDHENVQMTLSFPTAIPSEEVIAMLRKFDCLPEQGWKWLTGNSESP